ncbi:hypothetical protein Gbem_2813 [Citrifermentans bemidjiense Bem]|uniref:Uncharacterized protein n=1 Tax=Citrifermentans bemidjiense (strain ATCC BAA-1014 / DSM 16622 / JCM 12645 / Bem) TaxID=404380 RepID=B5EIB5_CITBB|nr:hypothetical protein [Citrifermentans bemidjiense]ACH39817.1 hypothetical protein Gbem_2813 [Citrifermentans bemidjiense Bem]
MEIFGGFMMMMSILGFFLVVIWFLVPFLILSIKGKVDRTLVVLEEMEKRIAVIERTLEIPRSAAPADPQNHPQQPVAPET